MHQEVAERNKESPGGPWQFVGLLPLFDPPRHDSAETIRRALNLGVNVKMITGISFVYQYLRVLSKLDSEYTAEISLVSDRSFGCIHVYMLACRCSIAPSLQNH